MKKFDNEAWLFDSTNDAIQEEKPSFDTSKLCTFVSNTPSEKLSDSAEEEKDETATTPTNKKDWLFVERREFLPKQYNSGCYRKKSDTTDERNMKTLFNSCSENFLFKKNYAWHSGKKQRRFGNNSGILLLSNMEDYDEKETFSPGMELMLGNSFSTAIDSDNNYKKARNSYHKISSVKKSSLLNNLNVSGGKK